MKTPTPRHQEYDDFATDYDHWDTEHRAVARQRRQLVHRLTGRILEIGVGTGLTIESYPTGADVTGIDVSEAMLRQACIRARQRASDAPKLLKADAEDLPFLDDSFDVAVGIFVFCSFDKPEKAAKELRRVVRLGGRFVTLGYHTPMVANILRAVGWKIRSEGEWQDPTDDGAIGRIIAYNPRR